MKYAAAGRQVLPWVIFLAAIVVCSAQGPFLLSVATVTLLWVVLASGLNIIMGHGGLVNFGIGAFYGIGSYVAANLAVKHGVSLALCLVAGPVIAAVAAAVIGPVILARTRGFQFAIATLAVGIVVDDLFTNWTPVTGGVLGIAGIVRPAFLQGTTRSTTSSRPARSWSWPSATTSAAPAWARCCGHCAMTSCWPGRSGSGR